MVGPKTMQLLKAMRGQLGDASASRSVDAVAAAEGLGMDTKVPLGPGPDKPVALNGDRPFAGYYRFLMYVGLCTHALYIRNLVA